LEDLLKPKCFKAGYWTNYKIYNFKDSSIGKQEFWQHPSCFKAGCGRSMLLLYCTWTIKFSIVSPKKYYYLTTCCKYWTTGISIKILELQFLIRRKIQSNLCINGTHRNLKMFNKISDTSWWSVLLVEGNRSTRRKPQTCHKSLINFIDIL
jgi:hypothetical protein